MTSDLKPYESATQILVIKIETTRKQKNGKKIICEVIPDIFNDKRDKSIDGNILNFVEFFDLIYPAVEKTGMHINWIWRFMYWLNGKIRSRDLREFRKMIKE